VKNKHNTKQNHECFQLSTRSLRFSDKMVLYGKMKEQRRRKNTPIIIHLKLVHPKLFFLQKFMLYPSEIHMLWKQG